MAYSYKSMLYSPKKRRHLRTLNQGIWLAMTNYQNGRLICPEQCYAKKLWFSWTVWACWNHPIRVLKTHWWWVYNVFKNIWAQHLFLSYATPKGYFLPMWICLVDRLKIYCSQIIRILLVNVTTQVETGLIINFDGKPSISLPVQRCFDSFPIESGGSYRQLLRYQDLVFLCSSPCWCFKDILNNLTNCIDIRFFICWPLNPKLYTPR